MRRKNDIKKTVKSPATGLVTRFPSDLTGEGADGALSDASNVRAQDGTLSNAPGYERVVLDGDPLETPPINIWQANIRSTSRDTRKSVLLGTYQTVFELKRRSVDITCDGECKTKFAFVADGGKWAQPAADVSAMIRSWGPDFVVYGGDLVYAGGYDEVGGGSPSSKPYEDLVAQYYWPFIGGYAGDYGTGPTKNKFFPTVGNHDLTDFPYSMYAGFFDLPWNERYYSFKKGPVHIVMLSSNEAAYSAYDGYDAVAWGSAQATWAADQIVNSDCPWVVVCGHAPPYTSDASHDPGLSDVRWLDSVGWFSLGLWGHAHNYERLVSNGFTHMVCGSGGFSLRGFIDPVLPESVFQDFADYGAVLVEADSTSLVAKFYHRDGTLVDTFTNSTPLRALTQCYSVSLARSLEIKPIVGVCEVGRTFQFRAILTNEDGTKQDVTTNQTTWEVDDGTIASIDKGLASGIDIGSVTVTAIHKGLSATATLEVNAACVDLARDWIFCIERTTSMGAYSEGKTILQHIGDAIEPCTLNMQQGLDKSGVTSFAGNYDTQAADAYINHQLDSDLTQTVREVKALSGYGESDISGGLDLCYEQLIDTDVHNSDDTRGVVVLVVDGPARVTDPGGDGTEATAMAAAKVSADRIKVLPNAILVVIGWQVPQAYKAGVEELATPGYWFDIEDINDLRTTIEQLPGLICQFGDNPYNYYYSCVSPQLDYTGFINWDVTNGVVDLCGVGTNGIPLYNQFPGNGLYVDMCGSNPKNSIGNKSFNGHMTTKVAYNFEAGKRYKLSVDVAGNGRHEQDANLYVRFKVGSLLERVVTFPPGSEFNTFSTFSWEFDGAAVSESIEMIMEKDKANDPYSVVGLFVKDVKLENLTDTTVLLLDSFDGENAC